MSVFCPHICLPVYIILVWIYIFFRNLKVSPNCLLVLHVSIGNFCAMIISNSLQITFTMCWFFLLSFTLYYLRMVVLSVVFSILSFGLHGSINIDIYASNFLEIYLSLSVVFSSLLSFCILYTLDINFLIWPFAILTCSHLLPPLWGIFCFCIFVCFLL